MAYLGLLFDVVMTGLLAATIFYAVRLSRDLETFRTTRADLSQAMQDIASHVTKAQGAVEELRLHAGQSAVNLQSLVTQADQVARELEMVIAAGDALANRLTSRAESAVSQAAVVPDRPYQARGDAMEGPAFSIQDREYDGGSAAPSGWGDETGDDTDDDGFFSQAERDLAAVLNKRRQKRG